MAERDQPKTAEGVGEQEAVGPSRNGSQWEVLHSIRDDVREHSGGRFLKTAQEDPHARYIRVPATTVDGAG